MRSHYLPVASIALLGACTRAPSISVLGAYFPGWMFCIVGALLAVLLLRKLLMLTGLLDWLAPPMLFFPALMLLLALSGWYVYFRH